jgi:Condensation domain
MANCEVPLAPLQVRFFRDAVVNRSHFNQARLLEAPSGTTVHQLLSAWTVVAERHDVFGLRFECGPDGWSQQYVGAEGAVVGFEASGNDPIDALAAQAHAWLDISKGPLCAVIAVPRAGAALRFLTVINHLIVDDRSWHVLTGDLGAALTAAQRERPPASGSSFRDWAGALRRHSERRELCAESEFWIRQLRDSALLPVPDGSGLRDSGQLRRRVISGQLAALQASSRAAGMQFSEMLLAALGSAARAVLGKPVAIDVEGHGREPIASGLAVHNTVGWFTCISPRRFDSPDLTAAIEQIRSYRKVAFGGLNFGVLRYLRSDSAELSKAALPWMSFEYQDARERSAGAGHPIRVREVGSSTGEQSDPRNPRWYRMTASAILGAEGLHYGLDLDNRLVPGWLGPALMGEWERRLYSMSSGSNTWKGPRSL